MLANELGRRGIRCLLVDSKPSTAFNPQANATQARTMEHFRRLGFAHEIRALGLPGDHPTDIAYFTRYLGYELARLRLPTAPRPCNSQDPRGGFLERGGTAAPRLAEVRRGDLAAPCPSVAERRPALWLDAD